MEKKTAYRHGERSNSCYVWFKTLDKGGKVLKDYQQAACFAPIASNYDYPGYGMHKDTKTIHVYRSKASMPYNVPEIKRWINDLNELGFPCRFADDGVVGDDKKQEQLIQSTVSHKKDMQELGLAVLRAGHPAPVDPNENYNFYVELKDYQDKSHLFSTLSLIRMLSESYYDKVPEIYFQMLDNNPGMDKFQALQTAHKEGGASSGHCVTYKGNGDNISHETLMKRFKDRKDDLWKANLAINASWRGANFDKYGY